MGTIAITGAASGIGAAAKRRLEGEGHAIIDIDLHRASIEADLGTADGRAAMIEQVTERSGGSLDALIASAGTVGPDPELVIRVNYFGALATLEGLRPLLAESGGAAVALSSNSCTTVAGLPAELIEACLSGDEEQSVALASDAPGQAYAAGKLALARWVRRNATTRDWIGSGVRLNAVAPGLIDTPMMEERVDFVLGLGDVYPIPVGRAGKPEEIASLIGWMVSPDATFLCGSVLFLDGGSDAALNADAWPAASGIEQTWPSMD